MDGFFYTKKSINVCTEYISSEIWKVFPFYVSHIFEGVISIYQIWQYHRPTCHQNEAYTNLNLNLHVLTILFYITGQNKCSLCLSAIIKS